MPNAPVHKRLSAKSDFDMLHLLLVYQGIHCGLAKAAGIMDIRPGAISNSMPTALLEIRCFDRETAESRLRIGVCAFLVESKLISTMASVIVDSLEHMSCQIAAKARKRLPAFAGAGKIESIRLKLFSEEIDP
jgi:hypothetical protein